MSLRHTETNLRHTEASLADCHTVHKPLPYRVRAVFLACFKIKYLLVREVEESLVYLVCFSMSGVTHIINGGAIVSGVRVGRPNKEISEFKNIPMSRMKKHKKDNTDFINAGNSHEDYDITRKSHKRHTDVHDHDIIARVHELVDTDPSKSIRAMARELEVSATLV